jgi:hypothetical protein
VFFREDAYLSCSFHGYLGKMLPFLIYVFFIFANRSDLLVLSSLMLFGCTRSKKLKTPAIESFLPTGRPATESMVRVAESCQVRRFGLVSAVDPVKALPRHALSSVLGPRTCAPRHFVA